MGYALLTDNQAKMALSLEHGYYSVILQLQPAYKYKGNKTCPWAGECARYCLQHTGHNRFNRAELARIRRTKLFYDKPLEFMALLCADIESALRKADRLGLTLTVRLNGLSDLEWIEIPCFNYRNIFERFKEVIFIDYTKSIERSFESCGSSWPENYTVVYSYNETSVAEDVQELLSFGGRVAVVFDTPKGQALPLTLSIGRKEYHVCDGDISDLRHLDPAGSIIGLRYKRAYSKRTRKALKVTQGFINIGRSNHGK